MKEIIQANSERIMLSGRLLRIARSEGDGYESLAMPEATIKSLKDAGTRIDIFTFLDLRPEDGRIYKYAKEIDNAAVISITSFDQWWNRQIRPEARNRARQAEKKGVVVREVPFDDDLIRGIWQIYNETPFRQGRPFPHYGKDLQTVYKESATFLDKSFFIGAFLNGRLIGFVKLTTNECRSRANLMNILSMIEHRDKAPTNALLAHSVRACESRGISQLVYQRYMYGNKKADGIMKFKQVNGFQRVDLPRYYVPITPRGAIALKFGLHHRLSERLPESVAEKLRNWRSSWYAWKFQQVKESA